MYKKTTGRDDLTTSDCAFRLDVNFFSPTAWVAPTLQFSNSNKDWFRESWELKNNNILYIVGGGGGKEAKELASNVVESRNNVASLCTDGPGRTVIQDEEEEKEENNLVWSASDNNFGAKKEEEIFGKKANNSAIEKHENYGNTEMDDASAEKEAEADRMHPTSCSGSFEWDGIPERNEDTDVKSKPKEDFRFWQLTIFQTLWIFPLCGQGWYPLPPTCSLPTPKGCYPWGVAVPTRG